MADLAQTYAEMHEIVAEQVLEDLKSGDRKARQEAMQLLKQNNVTATASEGSTLKKLKDKLIYVFLLITSLVFNKKSSNKISEEIL